MVITSAPAEERERSGSKPRFPYQGEEPFQGPTVQQYKPKERRKEVEFADQRRSRPNSSGRRLPKELQNVKSTIKWKVENDKQRYH